MRNVKGFGVNADHSVEHSENYYLLGANALATRDVKWPPPVYTLDAFASHLKQQFDSHLSRRLEGRTPNFEFLLVSIVSGLRMLIDF